jgi:hypothetical protein
LVAVTRSFYMRSTGARFATLQNTAITDS